MSSHKPNMASGPEIDLVLREQGWLGRRLARSMFLFGKGAADPLWDSPPRRFWKGALTLSAVLMLLLTLSLLFSGQVRIFGVPTVIVALGMWVPYLIAFAAIPILSRRIGLQRSGTQDDNSFCAALGATDERGRRIAFHLRHTLARIYSLANPQMILADDDDRSLDRFCVSPLLVEFCAEYRKSAQGAALTQEQERQIKQSSVRSVRGLFEVLRTTGDLSGNRLSR